MVQTLNLKPLKPLLSQPTPTSNLEPPKRSQLKAQNSKPTKTVKSMIYK